MEKIKLLRVGVAPPVVPRLTRKAYHTYLGGCLRREIENLRRVNLNRDAPLLGTAPADVSMTTHGERLKSVYLAIESIGRGHVRPRRLILWLDDAKMFDHLPAPLLRLQARGLEVRLTPNFGPHTKYWPYVSSDAGSASVAPTLVTADDDVIMPRYWLKRLLDRATPAVLTAYRAHRVSLNSAGSFAPYNEWTECWTTDASFANFPTGFSGLAYPFELQAALRDAGTRFLESAPKADDIWLHHVSAAAGIPTQQVYRWPLEFPTVPGSQDSGLFLTNVRQSANDEQIALTYDDLSRRRIIQSIAAGSA